MRLSLNVCVRVRRGGGIGMLAAATVMLASCQPAREEEPAFAGQGEVVEVDGADLKWCDPISQRVTVDDCHIAERTLEKVEEGTGLIEWPNSIRRGERAIIRLKIGSTPEATAETSSSNDGSAPASTSEGASSDGSASSDSSDEGETTVDAPTTEPDPVEKMLYTPLVGRFMSAQLTGAGFDISPSGPVSKELPPNSQIGWEWTIVAKHDGLQTLVVTTNVEFEDSTGKLIPLRTAQKEKSFDVKVGVLGWIEDFLADIPDWLELVTAVLVALTGTVAAYFGLRKVLKTKGEGAG